MHKDLRIAICASVHIQPSEEWVQSLVAITKGKNVKIIISDDSDGKVELPDDWDVYGYKRQQAELADGYDIWKMFQKSSSCKNFAHYIAYKKGYEIIMGIDSDCIVPPSFIGQHLDALTKDSFTWTNPLEGTGWFPRGYPYAERKKRTVLNLGLWNNELDLYGKDRVDNPGMQTKDPQILESSKIAHSFIPLSGMNWACWADAIPGLLFLPNFEYRHGEKEFKFRRHDDIWGGYIFQSIMSFLGDRIRYGNPVVFHDTVVDAARDAEEEEGMIDFEDTFYTAVDNAVKKMSQHNFTIESYQDGMSAFCDVIKTEWVDTEFEPLILPIKLWVELFNN